MSYSGSSTLSQEIQQRVVTTFEQTLDLASNGSVQEAKLGCDFILQLDSLFQPARLLRERLEGANGAVPTDDLRSNTTPEAAAAEALDLGDLSDLDLDVDLGASLEAPSSASAPAPAPPAPFETQAIGTLPDLALETPSAEPGISSGPLGDGGDLGGGNLLGSDAPILDTPSLDAPAGGGIDLGGPSGSDDDRIEELLAEGQAAYDSKEYQSAIDAWSRVFLIDVDHAEASRRIELARNLKAEHERQVEESFHEAMSLLDSGDRDGAERELEKVLEMQPGHLTAKEYLDKIRSGSAAPTPSPVASPASSPASSPAPDSAQGDSGSDALSAPALPELGPDLSGSPTPPADTAGPALSGIPDVDDLLDDPTDAPNPDVDIDAAPISDMPAQTKPPKGSPSKKFIAIGSGVLLLVLAGGGLVWSKWDSMFPNAAEAPTNAPSQPDPIARAQRLHENGKTSNAIGILKRLSPTDPDYQEAQALIEQWQVAQQSATEALEGESGPSDEDLALREILISQAQEAAESGRYIRAQKMLADASAIAPLEETLSDLQGEVETQIAPIASELAMFRQGDWQYAVPSLWRVVDKDPSNVDALYMLSDAYYNLGVRDLQRGDLKGAVGHFGESYELSSDEEAERLRIFASTYLNRSEDLLYRTFVKYLPFREI